MRNDFFGKMLEKAEELGLEPCDYCLYSDRCNHCAINCYGGAPVESACVGDPEKWVDEDALYELLEGELYMFEVKRVIFSEPATVVFWDDGTKSVVKCQNGEEFDREKGFVMAYLKKLLGNDNTFNKEIRKWVQDG